MKEKVKIWMNNVMHRIMLSCDNATFFMTKKDYQKLSCKENVQLKMHLMGCKFCRTFNDQNVIISDKIKMLHQKPLKAELSEARKVEIQQALDSKS